MGQEHGGSACRRIYCGAKNWRRSADRPAINPSVLFGFFPYPKLVIENPKGLPDSRFSIILEDRGWSHGLFASSHVFLQIGERKIFSDMKITPFVQFASRFELEHACNVGGYECLVVNDGALVTPPTKTVKITDWERRSALMRGDWSVKEKD